MMKASQKGRARPSILFSQTPHSIARRAKRLPNRTAAELLRYLCELTIGFGKGFVDLTYAELADALGKGWRTIARAAKLLRGMGDVAAEALRNRSYRWYVLLEPEDIVADPNGIYRVRANEEESYPTPHHDKNGMTPMSEMAWGHDKNGMTPMSEMACPSPLQGTSTDPDLPTVCASFSEVENGALKIDLKDRSLKIHHQSAGEEPAPLQDLLSETGQSDDDSLDHQNLFRKLQGVGLKQRMTRRVLKKYEHTLIARVLARVASRNDIENPAGYLLQELKDGGYEESSKPNVTTPNKDHVKPSDAPVAYGTADQTRAEMARFKAEGEKLEATYRQSVKALFERFQGLTETLKVELKSCWTRRLETLLPNTPKKSEMMKQEVFKRMAFKEVAEQFFTLVDDEGLPPEVALLRLAA